MADRESLRIVDDLLRVLMGNNRPFGGNLVIVSGDFRQMLPVKQGLTPEMCAEYSPCKSQLWQKFRIYRLTENRRAAADPPFSAWLQKVGKGTHIQATGYGNMNLRVPDRYITKRDTLIARVFGANVLTTATDRAILCPTNAEAAEFNEEIINSLPGTFPFPCLACTVT